MPRDIAAIYENANEASDSSGQFAFEANPTWPPMPIDAGAAFSDSLSI